MRIQKARGFTLIELIIVILLMGIIMAVASKMLSQGLTGYLTSKNLIEAEWQGQIGLERMARDIHLIRSLGDISTASASQLIYTDTSGTSITFQLSGTTLMRNSQVLADGVQSLIFSYFNKNGASTSTLSDIRYITISLNVTQNNTNITLTTSIYPRNLV